MYLGINSIAEEYTKRMGYISITKKGWTDFDFKRVLVKITEKEDDLGLKEMQYKAVVIFHAARFNIRSSKEARNLAYKFLSDYRECDKITKENLLIIVMGGNGHGHHFPGRNIVYYNNDKARECPALVSKSMWQEYMALKDVRNEKKWMLQERKLYYPERNRHSSVFIYVVIAITVICYIMTMNGNDKFAYSALAVKENGEAYRLFTYILMHGNIRHLVSNMAALFVVGRIVMQVEGVAGFLTIYLGGGIIGALIDCEYTIYIAGNVTECTVGASGAIFALIGALVIEAFTDHELEKSRGRIILYAVETFALSSIGGNINVSCHLFGLISGMVITLVLRAGSVLEDDDERVLYHYKRKYIKKRRKARGYEEKEWYRGPAN